MTTNLQVERIPADVWAELIEHSPEPLWVIKELNEGRFIISMNAAGRAIAESFGNRPPHLYATALHEFDAPAQMAEFDKAISAHIWNEPLALNGTYTNATVHYSTTMIHRVIVAGATYYVVSSRDITQERADLDEIQHLRTLAESRAETAEDRLRMFEAQNQAQRDIYQFKILGVIALFVGAVYLGTLIILALAGQTTEIASIAHGFLPTIAAAFMAGISAFYGVRKAMSGDNVVEVTAP